MKKVSTYFNIALLTIAVALFMVSCKSDKTAEAEVANATQTPTKVVQPSKTAQPAAAQRNAQNNQQRQLQIQQNNQRRNKPRSFEPKVPGGKINWMTFEQAEKAMKKNPKKVFVDVYTDWCGWCKRLDKATFADKRVADYMNDNFYAIKFDAQHPDPIKLKGKEYANPRFDKTKSKRARNATHQLALQYRATSYPTVLFLNEDMKLIKALPGYRDSDAFLAEIRKYESL